MITTNIIHRKIKNTIDNIAEMMYNIGIMNREWRNDMESGFQKKFYVGNQGFRLHYTTGQFAGESTTGYPHYEVEQSFIYFRRGAGEIKIEGRHYTIDEGDIILLKPSELCHCTVQDGIYHERITLYFNESLVKNFHAKAFSVLEAFNHRKNGVENKISQKTVEENRLHIALEEMLELAQTPTEINQLISVCKLIEILAKLSTLICGNSMASEEQIYENPIIRNVIGYINRNFSRDIDLEQIAVEFHVDKYYLSHLFKEQVGVTVWNYVIFRRLTALNERIRKNESIENACFAVGFQNYSNFYRLYKKHMHMTPMQYKKSLVRE